MNLLDPNSIPLLVAVGGALIWLIRLEGRVNTSVQRVDDLRADVQYIRRRIDSALNGRGDE